VKITDSDHESCGRKPSQRVEMFATKSVTTYKSATNPFVSF